jgi:hypothetical protein
MEWFLRRLNVKIFFMLRTFEVAMKRITGFGAVSYKKK